MTYLWSGMLLTGIVYGIFTGHLQAVTEEILSSSREAVDLCITMAGITAMWTGMLKIAERSGLVEKLSALMKPFLKLLFPGISGEEKALGYISANFLSNMLGLGWASTASGLQAFRELDRIHKERCERFRERNDSSEDCRFHGECGSMSNDSRSYRAHNFMSQDVASREMCTFLIINVSSLQLIPMSLLAYRAQYGSRNPTAIAGPALLTTICSTCTAILFCLWMNRKSA